MVHQLGDRLRRRREELELSQREVAERAGVSHTAIARVEAGRRRISLELFQRAAKALDIEVIIRLEVRAAPEDVSDSRPDKRASSEPIV